jgi:hypothetical protein
MPLTLLGTHAARDCKGAVRTLLDRATIVSLAPSLPYNRLHGIVTSMRETDLTVIKPLVDNLTANQINTLLTFPFAAGWGANPAAHLTSIRSALVTFYAAARTLLNSIDDPVTVDGAGETQYAEVDVTSLHPSINTLLGVVTTLEG